MEQTSEGNRGADLDHGFPIVIATMPATGRQRKIAFAALVVLAGFTALTISFANIQLARVDAFVPVIQTVMSVIDLLTAALLLAQYSIYPQRAVLVLASGYVFSGLFAFLQTLAFAGAYAPAPLIGDALNSAGWLFVLWHTTFLLAVVVYAMAKDAGEAADRSTPSTGVTIGVTVAGVLTATAGLTWVATGGVGSLPSLYRDATTQASFAHVANIFLALLNVTALALLIVRRRTILDHWLIVVVVAWLPNLVLSVQFTVVRYTLVWYAARVFALCAGSSLLFALLAEAVVVYTRLANAFVLLRRERTDRRVVFDTVVDGIITIDHHGIVEALNPAAARLFGYGPQEVVGHNVNMLMPEPYRGEHDTYLASYLRTGDAKVIGVGREVTGLRRDGSTFPMELAVGETGQRRFTGIVRDITARKQAEAHQKLLIAELDHRVKNVLVRVAAIVTETGEHSRSMDDFVRTLDGRIKSMAAAHALLSKGRWQGVGIADLIRDQLAPYATRATVTIEGPNITLAAAATQALGMVVHELATNAVKFGALSAPLGRVSIRWDAPSGRDGAAELTVEWRESSGPPVSKPTRLGFGTSLIGELISHELGGAVDLVFDPDGVICRMRLPLGRTEPALH
jgi:PAS domain S-box-containing protein